MEFPTKIDKQCQEIVIYMCPRLRMHKVASKGELMVGLWFDLIFFFFFLQIEPMLMTNLNLILLLHVKKMYGFKNNKTQMLCGSFFRSLHEMQSHKLMLGLWPWYPSNIFIACNEKPNTFVRGEGLDGLNYLQVLINYRCVL